MNCSRRAGRGVCTQRRGSRAGGSETARETRRYCGESLAERFLLLPRGTMPSALRTQREAPISARNDRQLQHVSRYETALIELTNLLMQAVSPLVSCRPLTGRSAAHARYRISSCRATE